MLGGVADFGELRMHQEQLSHALVSETEAARLLGLKVKTLRRWRWAGKGPGFIKLGSAVRYRPADLDGFITASQRTSTSDVGAGLSSGRGA
jgi:Helix-turn-helix domain